MSTAPLATAIGDAVRSEPAQPSALGRLGDLMRGALRGGAIYALGDQIVFSFGNMVVAALLSRHCTPVAFGVYILTQRVMDVLIQLSNGFLWTPLTFALPRLSAERRAQYEGSIVFLQSCLCLLFTGALWLLSRCTTGARHVALHDTFAPLVLTGGGILFREFNRRVYFAHLRMRAAFWTDVATVALQIAAVEWMYRTGHLDVPHALLALCAGSLAVSLWWLITEWSTWKLNARTALQDLRQDLRLGGWLFGGNLVALGSAQCNPWILNGLLGSASVGTYSICESLVNIPRAGLTSMQNVMGPVVARAHADNGMAGVRASVRRLNFILLASSSLSGLVVWAASPLIARVIYHSVPGDTRTIAGLLALNLVAFVCTLAQSYGLTALGRADATLYANLAGLFIQLGISALLVRWLHVPGAAAALLLGSIVVLGARQWFYLRAMIETRRAVCAVTS